MKKFAVLFAFLFALLNLSSCTADGLENESTEIKADDLPNLPTVTATDVDHGGDSKDKDKDGF